ncbi:glycerate kinase [Stackebrandtia soli]|uniref:glycerate kinase family protein n=1 Tax=Stackebrandtia soli TaxID=1892856 RepID=UPI0039EB8E9C
MSTARAATHTVALVRVLICPDKFAGTVTAAEAAAAIAAGWRDVDPDADLVEIPLADGGPGMLDSLELALGGSRRVVDTYDPLGRPIEAAYLRVDDTAYIESAAACGLHLVDDAERDPSRTTTFGLGLLIADAIETGARTVVVGLGGSATNDGGAGLLIPLGLTALDGRGLALPYGGAALVDCDRLDGSPRLRDAVLVAATDVDNPLCGINGASAVFGPQKGADANDVQVLDHALRRFAAILAADVEGCPPDIANLPGSGAAGGAAAALLALGAQRTSGAALVRSATGLDARLDEASLVITGEGSFDHQTLGGKIVVNVANAAAERGLPCTVVAGRVSVGRREAAAAGITRTYSLAEHYGSVEEAMRRPLDGLRVIGATIARQWRR